ncbi:MAG: type I phosphomannose isomerase catalytic subunit [Bacteroidia bacterium]
MLYPLLFEPVYLTKIWGGEHLAQELGRDLNGKKQVGESWELSGVEGQVSVVRDGPLRGKSLDDLVERYGADLLGHRVMAVHGDRFPLLFKLLSTAQDLSLQVHPNDEQAGRMVGQGALGKTEMWVILGTEPGACLYNGFVGGYDGKDLEDRVRSGRLMEVVHRTEVKPGDVFYIPAGRVHTIGAGLLLAEIQQSSDTTYRIDDFGRLDDQGKPRALHLEEAIAVAQCDGPGLPAEPQPLEGLPGQLLARGPYFECHRFDLQAGQECRRDHVGLDSPVVLMNLRGKAVLEHQRGQRVVSGVQTIMLPAAEPGYVWQAQTDSQWLEVCIPRPS